MRSLRMRMFVGATAVSLAVLSALGIAIDQSMRSVLRAQFDSELRQKARALASMVEQQGPEIHFDYQRTQFSEFEPADHPAYFEIWLDGKIFQQSSSMAGRPHLVDTASATIPNPYQMPDGPRGRMVRWDFQPFVEPPETPAEPKVYPRPNGIVIVVQNTLEFDRTLLQIRALIAGLCGMAAVLVGALMLFVARQTTRPLQQLANNIESMGPTDLAKSLTTENLPAELLPVVDRLNNLLARLSDAFDRERTFAADVAHELRTPLAGLLMMMDVSRSRVREPEAYAHSIEQCVAVLKQMESLVERLLLLARAEGGQLNVQHENLDLEPLAIECWMSLESAAREKQLTFSFDPQTTHVVIADDQLLRIVFKNLLDNAISYSTPASAVTLSARKEGNRTIAEVSSSGHDLTQDDLRHLFDRFWRKDKSRSKSERHAGLGLTLCQRLLALQKGGLQIRLDKQTFIAAVELPSQET